MNSFIVSARKYRPDTFDTVVGQSTITHTLKNAIRNNHLAQAFLFCGPRGVGKTTTARILAKTINCSNISQSTEACNQCESCRSFNEGSSLNIFELDAASNNSVDDIRVLVDQVRYAPQGGKFKVYIIDEVHMLSASAFNAFLKTLEEPPSYAIFILATTEKHKIIPTILSRCQIFDFNRITVDDIAKQLQMIAKKEEVVAEEDALHIIAQKADGALRDALSMFDQQVSFSGNNLTYKSVIENLNVLDYDYYFKVTNEILAGNISAVLLTFNQVLNFGFDGHNFIGGLASHFRDLLVCQDEVTLKLLEVSASVREKYKIQSKQCEPAFLLELLESANKCDMSYRSAKHQRLHVELALMKMCSLTGEKKKSYESPGLRSGQVVVEKSEGTLVKESSENLVSEKKSTALNEAGGFTKTPVKNNPEIREVKSGGEEKAGKPSYRGSKTISISEGLKAKPKDDKLSVEEELINGEDKFNPEELEKRWNEFASILQKDGRLTLHTTLTKRTPVIKDDFSIHFIVDNVSVDKDITGIKADLLAFLRQSLNNRKITLLTSIEREEKGKKTPYTPKEKFEFLASKNPALNELKKQFDLEIEY